MIEPIGTFGPSTRTRRSPSTRRFFMTSVAVALSLICVRPAGAETLHDAIISAWARDPVGRAANVDAMAAHRTADASESWFPGGPVINGEYLDDHFIGSNVGYTTYQGSIGVPLWLPGQGTATVKNALADEAAARANGKVARLAMAVRLLDLTSAATLLTREAQNMRQTSAVLAQALQATSRALAQGEIPATDNEALLGEKEDLDGRIAETEQKIEATRAELETLTGQDTIPDLMNLDGHLLVGQGLSLDPKNDPRIEMANATVQAAHASYNVAAHSFMPAPEVGIMVLKQGQYGSPWDTQVGVQFSTTLPSEARNTPMMMKETKAIGAAERDAELTRRKVTVEYRQTRAQLASALEILRHADRTQKALQDRAGQMDKAWRVGETSAIEYLRARQAALAAQQRATQADVIWHAAMVRMVLMAGRTP